MAVSDARWALITGASSGIGRAFAHALAAQGWSCLLTGRNAARLHTVTETLRARWPRQEFDDLVLDLKDDAAVDTLVQWTCARTDFVEMLINNAGFGSFGRLDRLPVEAEIDMVRVHVEVPTVLTHRLLPEMIARRRGTIVFVGSLSGMMPTPYAITYAATKVYLERFGLALWEELRATGVRVYVLAPGFTATALHERAVGVPSDVRARFRRSVHRFATTPEHVVAYCLRRMERRPYRCLIIPGLLNRMVVCTVRMLPMTWVTRTLGTLNRMAMRRLGIEP